MHKHIGIIFILNLESRDCILAYYFTITFLETLKLLELIVTT